MTPEGRTTVAEEVHRALKREILTLGLRPGTPLREQELAERHGTSRVPVREACARLEQEGLITRIPYKGYSVSRISMREIFDSFELRLLLETRAAECAVERADEEGVERLEALAAREYAWRDRDTYLAFLDGNLEFHLALAGLCGNERLARVLGDLLESMQRYFLLGLELGDFGAEMRGEHEALTRAIRERSAEEAVRCTVAQIERSRERILAALTRSRADVPVT
jgi:DNA-binding GntR family transcriptional regulator